MIALVTGGTGFVGSYIIRQLLADKTYTTVRAICRRPVNSPWLNDIVELVEWHTADLNDIFALEKAMQGCTHVYHAAATVSFSEKAHKAMMDTNINGTANLINLALSLKVEKFGYISSVAALGRSSKNVLLDENTKWANDPLNTAYSVSKFYAEQEVWRGAAEGLNVVMVNPSIIMGAFDWRNSSPALIKTVAKGLKFYTVGSTGFIDVRDVAKAIALLVKSPIVNERYVLNVENLTYKRFFDLTADALQTPRPPYKAGLILSEIAWRAEALKGFFTGKKALITKETARTASHDFQYSSQKFLAAFPNYKFISLEASVIDTVAAYKSKTIKPFYPI